MKTRFRQLKEGELFTMFKDSELVYKRTQNNEAIFDHKIHSSIMDEDTPSFGIILGIDDVVYKAT